MVYPELSGSRYPLVIYMLYIYRALTGRPPTTLPSPDMNPSKTSRPTWPLNTNNRLLYGADYNPEQWPREVWQEDMQLMKRAGVNVVSVGIFSWALLQVAEDKWDFAWLDEVFDLCLANGVGVDLGTATASPPPWLTTKHPEILPVTANGDVLSPGGRQQWRPTSAIFRKYALALVRKLAERYGSHPALVAWHVNNELGCHNNYDYSDEAAAAFRKWLKSRYGTVEKLNDAWGTAFWSQHYTSFDQILPPRLAATYPNPTQQLDFKRFSSDALKDHLIAEKELLNKLTPKIPVTTNFMVMGETKGMNYPGWAEEIDFVSNDHYVTELGQRGRDELSFSASLSSGIAAGKPWFLMEHSTSAVNWQAVNVPKKAGEMARDSLSHVAHGADAVCYFQWRQSKAGAEKYHSSMVPHAGPDSEVFRDVCKLGEDLKRLSSLQGSHAEPAPVAILFDYESWWASELDSHPTTLLKYKREALDWYIAFLNLGIRVDVIPASSDFSSRKLVVGPILHMVDPALQDRITKYAEAGGHFVTTYCSGIVDENDHILLGGYPGAFRDLLGIRIEEFHPLREGDTEKLDDGSEVTLWMDRIDVVNKDVEVLRHIAGGEYDRRAAVTTRKLSKGGSATYVGVKLEADVLQPILKEILHTVKIDSDLAEGLRGKVEQVYRVSNDTRYEFLINRTDEELSTGGTKGEVIVSTRDASSGKLAGRGVMVLKHALTGQ